ncbi:phosphoglycerate dehydrogenase [bacterium]|nr:phosphoglycerate dehydrogenase [bacterium]
MIFRILISDKMSSEGLSYFTGHEGFEIVYDPEITMEALAERIGDFDALVIRSRTHVTRAMLADPGKLKIIGRAGAGVDNVDVEAATEKGIVVMNTPGGNTLSTAEHAISMLLSLARHIPQADHSMHEGKWDKKSIIGMEIDGKTLGIVGLGRIGRVVAQHMQAFGMEVVVYDPLLTAETAEKLGVRSVSIDEMCRIADAITVHAPLNDDTRGIIGREQFSLMKPGALVVNCARGGIVDEQALCEALRDRKIGGAALDVFEAEPLPADHPLRGLDNVILTPHLAASTAEAQEKVARDIAIQIREALGGEMIRNAVNAPSVDAKTFARIRHALDLCERLGRFCGQFVPAPTKSIEIIYSGTVSQHPTEPLTVAAIKGFLECHVAETVNAVNALYLAHQRDIHISETRRANSNDIYAGLVTVRTTSDSGETHEVSGTLTQENTPKIVVIDGRRLDMVPAGHMLVIGNRDLPGFIGAIGTALGNENINIAQMTVARTIPGTEAFTVISVDGPVPVEVLKKLQSLHNVLSVRAIVI